MTGQQSDMGFDHVEQADPDLDRLGRRKPRFARRWAKVWLRKVEVTQADIDKAMPEDSHSCMIADAIKRQYPHFKRVMVDVQSIRWIDEKKDIQVICHTPPVCGSKLAMFDYGVKPVPFVFDLKSIQVTGRTKTAPKLDEAGEVLRKERVHKGKPRADGTREADYVASEPVMRRVSRPSRTKEFVNSSPGMNPSRDHHVGGRPPPMNRASRLRQFGMRNFTWDKGENPEDIAKRQQVAYGWSDEQMAAEGWQFAKDRVAAKLEPHDRVVEEGK